MCVERSVLLKQENNIYQMLYYFTWRFPPFLLEVNACCYYYYYTNHYYYFFFFKL